MRQEKNRQICEYITKMIQIMAVINEQEIHISDRVIVDKLSKNMNDEERIVKNRKYFYNIKYCLSIIFWMLTIAIFC